MYNYPHFKPKDYDFSKFTGPKAGERVVDFEAVDISGEKKKLSDYFGKWIVLETGSITCPIYESKIKPMNELAREFLDVTFLVLYVREAHPGEKIARHETFDDKLSCARRSMQEDGEQRTILVDDLDGTAHKTYGSMPNSVYVINPDGRIVFRGDWNDIQMVRQVLCEKNSEKVYGRDRFSARPNFHGAGQGIIATLKRAGRVAVFDFLKALPVMIVKHIRKLWR